MLILSVSILLSGVVDNIPYTAAMSPILAQLTQGVSDPTPGRDEIVPVVRAVTGWLDGARSAAGLLAE